MKIEERLDRYLTQQPKFAESAYIAIDAIVMGAVSIGPESSVWHSCVLRADINQIQVGRASNIQDGVIVHLSDNYGVCIGDYVTIGHRAIIHACTVEDEVLVGMNATVMDGAVIGTGSIIGAGALVLKEQHIPPGSLVMGSPAKVVRKLDQEERSRIKYWAHKYVKVAAYHKRLHAQ